MRKKVLIFGGAGTASVIGQAIVHANQIGYNEYEFSGFVNDTPGLDQIDGYPVIGGMKDVPNLILQGYYFIYTIYKIGGQVERIKWIEDLNIPDSSLATFIHPTAYIAPNSEIGGGCVVMPGASISGNTKIGKYCLIMNGAAIGHDNLIQSHCFFTARCCLGSWLKIDQGAWIGLNATIRGKLSIGKYAAIGIGAVLTKDVKENEIWVGNPAKFHKLVSDKIAM